MTLAICSQERAGCWSVGPGLWPHWLVEYSFQLSGLNLQKDTLQLVQSWYSWAVRGKTGVLLIVSHMTESSLWDTSCSLLQARDKGLISYCKFLHRDTSHRLPLYPDIPHNWGKNKTQNLTKTLITMRTYQPFSCTAVVDCEGILTGSKWYANFNTDKAEVGNCRNERAWSWCKF